MGPVMAFRHAAAVWLPSLVVAALLVFHGSGSAPAA